MIEITPEGQVPPLLTISPSASKALACVFDAQHNADFAMTGENRQGGSYRYFKLEDLIGPLKPILKEHRCVLVFSTEWANIKGGFEKIQGNKDVTPRDKLVTYAECMVTARIQNIDDPKDYVASRCFGYKVDQTADKALGADTVACRYAVMHLVLAGTDIDPDSDAHDVRSGGLLGSIMSEPSGVSQPKSPLSNQPVTTISSLTAAAAPSTSGSSALSSALDQLINV